MTTALSSDAKDIKTSESKLQASVDTIASSLSDYKKGNMANRQNDVATFEKNWSEYLDKIQHGMLPAVETHDLAAFNKIREANQSTFDNASTALSNLLVIEQKSADVT